MLMYFIPVRLWIAARAAQVRVTITQLIGMRLRKVPPHKIVEPLITAEKAGLNVDIGRLEAHYLAGGNVRNVVEALISASKAKITLDFDRAASIDLAGRNVLEAVHMSVNPKVITSPKIAGVAADGIQVLVITRVTVRANIERLVGGAGEETILARV
ncbi:MAG: flotillin-like FloA family protein, partial [Acidobacteriota bacterium]